MNDLTRIQFDNIQDDTIKPQNLAISNPGSFGPNDIVSLSADGQKFEIIPNFTPDWVGLQLDKLSDVDIIGPVLNGQILEFNSTSSQWTNVTPGAVAIPAMSLDDLLDVTEAGAVDGDVLVFDFGTTQYINRKLSYAELSDIPSTFAPQAHSHSVSHINDWPFSGPPSIEDMSDVSLAGLAVGNILEWNGVAFVPGPKGTGVSVDSFIGRTGSVIAASGDYGTNFITNESAVTGAFLTDALNFLNAAGGAVDSVFGRAGVIVAAASDYDASQIDNDSTVVGAFISDALNALNTGKASNFVDLSDTPATLVVGDANKLVTVNALGTALVYTTPPANISDFANDSGFISDITAENIGDLFDVNLAGILDTYILEWDTTTSKFIAVAPPSGGGVTTFIALTDVIGPMGTAGQQVAVNIGGTALEFITSPTNVSDFTNDSGFISDITAEALGSLTDVVIAAVTDNEVLAFNFATSQWINQTTAEAGLATSAQGSLASSALQNVIEDTTPQLGGALDVNGKSITSATSTDITLTPGVGGSVVLGQSGAATLSTGVGEDLNLTPGVGGAVVLGQSGAATLISGAGEDLILTPGTTGDLVLDGLNWPQADGAANFVLKTDGAGQLSWVVASGGSSTFVALADTPGSMGTVGQMLAVNSGGTALEFVAAPSGGSTTLLGLTDVTPSTFTGQANKVVAVNVGETGVEFVSPVSGSGFVTEWVKINYLAGGTISSISSSTGVTPTVTLNAVNTNIRISISFNGVNGQDKPPASIMSYGYVRGNNNYIVQPLDLTFGGGNAVLDPGGVAGTPGDILNSFTTMSIDEIQVSTSTTGASTDNPGEPPHAILIIGW